MGGSINVMVTGVGGGGVGEQLIKALRCSTLHYQIIGADITPVSKGLQEADHSVVVPPASHPEYIETILNTAKQYEVVVLFPGSEIEMKSLADHSALLESYGLFVPINKTDVLDICMDKFKTMAFLKAHSFEVPKTVLVSSEADLVEIDYCPAILKPSRGSGGSANVMLAQRPEEILVFGRYLLDLYKEFIVQEYVGTPDSEYTVGVLHDMQGEYINSIGVKRSLLSALSNRAKIPNKTGRKEFGELLVISSGISQGEVGPFPEVTQVCRAVAASLKAVSAINLQCRLFHDRVFIFEINPRFSGTTSIRALAGYNEPDVLIRKHLLGESIEPNFAYRSGFALRGLAEVFITS